ncbi:uroporphyrinogen-III C-methyltransferase, partial [Vibrio parahaemolyticus]
MTTANSSLNSGFVSLVGAGPGDPDLLTVKGLKAIQAAEVVVYDRLVSKEILELAQASAEMIYVGKKLDFHCVPQDKINQILVEKAQEGKRVVRLKGGDSFIFGRGG